MSLRSFHIVFIFLSSALLFGFGYWEYKINQNLFFSILSAVLGLLLAGYLVWFISKIKKGPAS